MKQRLIDANELIIDILAHDISDDKQIDRIILDAPTVDAIPVEWIKKYGVKNNEIVETTLENVLYWLIKDWEKENE